MPNYGDPVLVNGAYPATFVCDRPDLGGYVVAFTGENGTTPGEQVVVDREDACVV